MWLRLRVCPSLPNSRTSIVRSVLRKIGSQALGDLMWAVLSSREFAENHYREVDR